MLTFVTRLAKIEVVDYMTKQLISVTPNTGITEAIQKRLAHSISGVPVVNALFTLLARNTCN